MRKKMDIVALGELLIDFTQSGISDGGQKLFEQNPGGAPANLLTVASHMGYDTAFIGKVGADMHGEFLKQILKNEGINITSVVTDKKYFTTLAFVEIDERGERNFSFARKPGADRMLQKEELDNELLSNCKIFHFGSLSLTAEPAKSATLEAIRVAKEARAIISYDPNYRQSLWENEEVAKSTMKAVVKYADIMKVSDEESLLLTGAVDYDKAADELLNMGPQLVAVTLGNKGVLVAKKDGSEVKKEIIPAFSVKAVDTTGAGDSFWGGFLSCYLSCQKPISGLTLEEIRKCAVTGNAVAGLCVKKRGGIPAIPRKEEVEDFVTSL